MVYEWHVHSSTDLLLHGSLKHRPSKGTIELSERPQTGEYVEIEPGRILQISKIVHRPGKTILLELM